MTGRALRDKALMATVLTLGVFVSAAVALGRPETPFVILEWTGRMHDGCAWRSTYEATVYERRRQAARETVAAQSTLVEQDGHLTLWRSLHGDAWIQGDQGNRLAPFWAGDLNHWPPRWAQLEVVPVTPVVRGSVVIDAGGHIGESAKRALDMGAGLVVSIEPDPLNAEALRRNLSAAIRDGRLHVVEKALWDSQGTLTLERHDASTRTTVGTDHVDGLAINVPMTTLDQIVDDLTLPRVDFIKMDIEGAEQHALRGAIRTMQRDRPILAVGSYHRPEDVDAIPRIVLDAQPAYIMTPLRCLVADGRAIPHLLYFHAARQ